MKHEKVADVCGTRHIACPARLQKRLRRNLVQASLNRMDKPRAQQALDVLTNLSSRAAVAGVPEQRSTYSAPHIPGVPPAPIAATRPAQDVSPGARHATPGSALGQQGRPSQPGSARDIHDPTAVPSPGAIMAASPAGPANQEPRSRRNR
jgi:hypothetical protein